VRLAAFSTVTMDDFSTAPTAWPSLHLTGVASKLEDGCQGATVTLAYSAKGTWWSQ
jgi:hypothetical protein